MSLVVRPLFELPIRTLRYLGITEPPKDEVGPSHYAKSGEGGLSIFDGLAKAPRSNSGGAVEMIGHDWLNNDRPCMSVFHC